MDVVGNEGSGDSGLTLKRYYLLDSQILLMDYFTNKNILLVDFYQYRILLMDAVITLGKKILVVVTHSACNKNVVQDTYMYNSD